MTFEFLNRIQFETKSLPSNDERITWPVAWSLLEQAVFPSYLVKLRSLPLLTKIE